MSDLIDEDGKVDKSEIRRRIKGALAVIIAVAVLVGGGWVAADKGKEMYLDFRQKDDYIGTGKDDTSVIIPAGASISQMATILADRDIVKTAKAFREAAAGEPKSTTIQPGTYRMKTQIPAATALQILIDPSKKVVKRVTVREGLRITAVVPILAKGSGLTEDAFNQALKNPAALGLPEYAKNNPEGFLFPDTYEVGDNPEATALLKQMTKRYGDVATQVNLDARAQAMGMTPYQILIVASIIEAEVSRDEDRPKVARAIYNRLASQPPMNLQLDTTVNYALNRSGHSNLRDGDTQLDNPYNTYKYPGLPPGPITNPGKKSIEAALTPAEGPWKFWVAVNLDTGETKFAETLDQHNANVKEYQDWCRANTGKCSS